MTHIQFWKHDCPKDGLISVAKGEPCNWCDAVEQAQPVAWMDKEKFEHLKQNTAVLTTVTGFAAFPEDVPLYTAPPPRQPLTDEQRREIAFRWRDGNGTASEIIDMVEAAHGIIKGKA